MRRARTGAAIFAEEMVPRSGGGRFGARAATPADQGFLRRLFAAASVQPPGSSGPLVEMQFAARARSYDAEHPHADQLILLRGDQPVGLLWVDFSDAAATWCLDLAVLPDQRAGAVGWRALCAWVAASDRLGRPARLSVAPHNPALALYRRLGFRPLGPAALPTPMLRPVRRAPAPPVA